MGKQLIQRLMMIRLSDTNHVWSTRVARLDESLMKVVCIAPFVLRAHLRARGSMCIHPILSVRNLGILSRADRSIYRGLLSDTVTTAHSVAVLSKERRRRNAWSDLIPR